MAHFYASVTGQRNKTVTKAGTKNSGLQAHLRGWDLGVFVEVNHLDGFDVIRVWETGGSNDSAKKRLIKTVTRKSQNETM